MRMLSSLWFLWAGLNGAAAVGLAAYAAHGMADRGDYILGLMDKATQMQGLHAAVLAGVAALTLWAPSRLLHGAAALFSIGILLFCGTLYGLAFGVLPTGRFAPFGGTSLMIGWLVLGLAGAALARRAAR